MAEPPVPAAGRLWPVVAATALAAVVLANGIARWPVWYDEGFTSMMLRYDAVEIVRRTGEDVHPPLYYLVLDVWASIVGDGLVSLRAFSLLCMLAAAVLIARITRATGLTSGPVQDAIVILAVTTGSATIIYAQEARMYGLGSLLVAASTLALVRLQADPTRRRVAVYGLCVAAAAYTHYFSLGFLLVHAAWVGVVPDPRRRKLHQRLLPFAGGLLVAAVAFAPWLPMLRRQLGRVGGDFWISEVTWRTPIQAFYEMFSAETLPQGASFELLVAIALVPLLIAAVGMAIGGPVRRHLALLALPLPVTILVLYVLSLDAIGFSSILLPRYLSQLAPFAYAGVACAAMAAFDLRRPLRWLPAVAAVALLLHGANLATSGASRQFRPELAALTDHLESRADDADLIVVDRYYHFYGIYHELDADPRVRVLYEGDHFGGLSLLRGRDDVLADVEDIAATRRTVWLVRDDPPLTEYRARDAAAFARWHTASVRAFDHLAVVELRPPSADPLAG